VIIYGVLDVLTTGRRDPLAKAKKASATKKRSGAKKKATGGTTKKGKAKVAPRAKSAPRAKAKSKAAPRAKAKSKSAPRTKAKSKSATRAKAKSKSAPRAKAKAKAAPRTRAKARATPAAQAAKGEVTPRALQDAVDRGRDWLAERRDYFGYLTRRDSGRGAPELAWHLRGDLRAKQGPDGSWEEGGDLAVTAESLWRLLDLGMAADSPVVEKALDWLYSRRDEEGAYSSGCTPSRHEARICEHFVSGFFSPGPSDEPQELTLSNGQTVTSDAGARLLASERVLRSVLRARRTDPRAHASVMGLRSLPLYLEYGGNYTPAVLVGALQALAWQEAPRSAELEAGLESLAGAQEKEGDWPNVEFFFVLEALLEIRHPAADRMLRQAVPRLLENQHKYGAWGRRHVGSQTWVAVQVLERVLPSARREMRQQENAGNP
jgi:hypothetical protein